MIAARAIFVAVALSFVVVTARAADNSLDKSAKKTGDGFGNLLKGMGQEVKKASGGDAKKSDKAAKADKDKK